MLGVVTQVFEPGGEPALRVRLQGAATDNPVQRIASNIGPLSVGDTVVAEVHHHKMIVHEKLNASDDTPDGALVPVGGIIMWSGTIAAIPSGWALCNGSNGTPDLRGRFIVGAHQDTGGTNAVNGTYNQKAASGTNSTAGASVGDSIVLSSTVLPEHGHSINSVSAGAHAHNPGTFSANSTGSGHTHGVPFEQTTSGTGTGYRVTNISSASPNGGGTNYTGTANSTGSGHTHDVSGTSAEASNHDHAITAVNAYAGAAAAIDKRPRWYALAFIQRIR